MTKRTSGVLKASLVVGCLALVIGVQAWKWPSDSAWHVYIDGHPSGARVYRGDSDRLWIRLPSRERYIEILWDRRANEVLRLNANEAIYLNIMILPKPGAPFGVSYRDTSKNDLPAEIMTSRTELSLTIEDGSRIRVVRQ